MAARPEVPGETREQRIDALMAQLRPTIEATVRRLVERAVDVPEAEEFGAIDFEFRDAGQELVNAVRQAGVAGRKKRGTSAAASAARTAATRPSSTRTRDGGC